MLQNFKKHYQPEENQTVVSKEILNEYQKKIPSSLAYLWKTIGFGQYNNGLIEMINPKDYESVLWTWLGKEMPNYIPFAITGFGELFYYRKLTEKDEDVCLLDIQYRSIENLSWNMETFFDDFLVFEENRKIWLREDLFVKATQEKGKLQRGEVFTFVPILAIGGAQEINNLKKGNAIVYQDLVFQMTS